MWGVGMGGVSERRSGPCWPDAGIVALQRAAVGPNLLVMASCGAASRDAVSCHGSQGSLFLAKTQAWCSPETLGAHSGKSPSNSFISVSTMKRSYSHVDVTHPKLPLFPPTPSCLCHKFQTCSCDTPAAGAARATHMAWNYRELLQVLLASPAVKLALAGHDHLGGYACLEGAAGDRKHFVTVEAMLEAPAGSNAWGVVHVEADKVRIEGRGTVTSRELLLEEASLEGAPS